MKVTCMRRVLCWLMVFLVLSGVATGEEAARRKTKKKKEQYHASQRDPRQAEELRDPLSEELQSLLNNALDFANRAHHEEALFLAQRALAIDSANAKATYIVGLVHLNKAQSELALKYLNGAVEKDPNNPTYLNALGNAYMQKTEYHNAVETYVSALNFATHPLNSDIHFNLGSTYERLGSNEDAMAHYQKSIALEPSQVAALHALGSLLLKKGQVEEAHYYFRKALSINPMHHHCLMSQALAYMEQGRFHDAVESFSSAIRTDDTNPMAHFNMGVALQSIGKLDEAMSSYFSAVLLRSDMFEGWVSLGGVLDLMHKPGEAIKMLQRAILLRSDNPRALGSYLLISRSACEWENEKSLVDQLKKSITPDYLIELGNTSPLVALYFNLDAEQQKIISQAHAQRLEHTAFVRRNSMREFNLNFTYATPSELVSSIKVGYMADFADEQTVHLLSGMLLHHDRHKVEIFCYSISPEKLPSPPRCTPSLTCNPDWKKLMLEICENFVVINVTAPMAAAMRINSDEIEILIDIAGHLSARSEILALRPAPIQVHWPIMGYRSTFGESSMIQYLLCEASMLSPNETKAFTEEAIFLQPSFYAYFPPPQTPDEAREMVDAVEEAIKAGIPFPSLPNPSTKDQNQSALPHVFTAAPVMKALADSPSPSPSSFPAFPASNRIAGGFIDRCDLGIPPGSVVFININDHRRIDRRAFGAWMNILKMSGDNSVLLLLLPPNNETQDNLRKYAEAMGVNPNRLIFTSFKGMAWRPRSLAEAREVIYCADIALDTFLYNSDLLSVIETVYAGLPIVTLRGKSFSTRMTGTILKALDVSELIGQNKKQYIDIAVSLAQSVHPTPCGPPATGGPDFHVVRKKLLDGRKGSGVRSKLWDPRRVSASLEQAFSTMKLLYTSGSPPQPFVVTDRS